MAPKQKRGSDRASGRHKPGSRTRANGHAGKSGWDTTTKKEGALAKVRCRAAAIRAKGAPKLSVDFKVKLEVRDDTVHPSSPAPSCPTPCTDSVVSGSKLDSVVSDSMLDSVASGSMLDSVVSGSMLDSVVSNSSVSDPFLR